ncbi:hypothetical protein ISF_08820 [Cordyceps fumosorosea ARSEF 2679]|uniref:Uncharacterized protein n=1 Tax=Cordyceps fumosorosea (strain ARSEF 2679) TaxID=1081104 RepID=A0A167LPJ5_CORFA|nr:hypothetical protein ISF_08820 [Cordyceps fumosorosea ARSEF 2679]OAA53339.1 hypothetical protein ISF_08820 [Cordyceps fumosorosea ARSEF 2679]
MKFSATLAILFAGLAAASPQFSQNPDGSINFTPAPQGPQNSQGFSQESCDQVRANHGDDLAGRLGCNEFK